MNLCLSSSYVMTNGYKPAPLDLSHVKLTPNQNQLVEKLAENGHNVWARDRVRQGWTYSIVQVSFLNPQYILYFILFNKLYKESHFLFYIESYCVLLLRTSWISETLVWYLTTCWMRELRKRTETVLTMLSVLSLAMATTLSLQIRRAVSQITSY